MPTLQPISERVHPSWASALLRVSGDIERLDAFLRDEVAAGRGYLPAAEHVLRAFAHPIEQVGAELRAMMPWIAKNKLVDKERN